ncbi:MULTISPECIES: hypothetical protein [Bacillus]|uniref:hypothetical protein n=1 Tax=Bacillus sp. SKDU12 TaxID=1337053 RepID=UPI00139E6D61|nr:hypothetical protein BTW01_10990 [Bacillus sp. SKDU12]
MVVLGVLAIWCSLRYVCGWKGMSPRTFGLNVISGYLIERIIRRCWGRIGDTAASRDVECFEGTASVF